MKTISLLVFLGFINLLMFHVFYNFNVVKRDHMILVSVGVDFVLEMGFTNYFMSYCVTVRSISGCYLNHSYMLDQVY